MGITSKKHYRGSDFNNKDLKDAKSLQLNQDAINADEAVRKSQSESISAQAVQDKLISDSGNASTDSAFTSSSLVSFLAAKQDNMSIHSSSTAYLELVGSEIKVKQLLVSDVTVNETSATIADYVTANPAHGKNEGDVIILTSATTNQERSWIHNGGSAGDASDFTKLVTDFNEASIRAMFSAGDSFISYDPLSGQYSLNKGTALTALGAQSLPVDSTEFTTITGSTTLAILKALEAFIISVDTAATGGAATLDTRLDTLSGVEGNSLESFTGSTFSDNKNIKEVLQESETKHEAADTDRGAIRTEFGNADTVLNAKIDAEIARATNAEATEASNRANADNGLQNNINVLGTILGFETQRATNAEQGLSDRLDVVEGADTVAGSISKAEKDAKAYADVLVANEAVARDAADVALNLKIDNLAEGDITFVGQVLADGTVSIRQDRIDAGDTRNGQSLMSIDVKAGETFVMSVSASLTYTDNSVVAYEAGDKLMLIDDVLSGNLVESKLNIVPANATGLSVINIGSSTIEIDLNNKLGVIADSIGRAELDSSIEADIDDKRSLTGSNAITSDSDTHFVTDTSTAATQNMYFKRVSNTSDALAGTKRAVLGELYVGSNGSGNPLAPCYAHTVTFSTHYQGVSTDMSMAVGGGNFEANVTNPIAAVYATGVYALAQSNQLGINSGLTGVAQNAGISNIGVTGFGKAGGVGKDRGGVFALSDLDFINYAGARSVSPISYPDVALIADAGTSASGKAFVAVGDSIFEGGSVTVPSAVNNTDAVNLSDLKDKEFASEGIVLGANTSVTINHNLGTKKVNPVIWVDDELSTSSFDIERSGTNAMIIYNDTADAVTLDIYITAMSI